MPCQTGMQYTTKHRAVLFHNVPHKHTTYFEIEQDRSLQLPPKAFSCPGLAIGCARTEVRSLYSAVCFGIVCGGSFRFNRCTTMWRAAAVCFGVVEMLWHRVTTHHTTKQRITPIVIASVRTKANHAMSYHTLTYHTTTRAPQATARHTTT